MALILACGDDGRLFWRAPSNNPDIPGMYDECLRLPNGNIVGTSAEIVMTSHGLDLRALLTEPSCTAGERELLNLLSELDAARADGLFGDGMYHIRPDYDGPRQTRIEGTRVAVAKVRELRAEKEAAAQADADRAGAIDEKSCSNPLDTGKVMR